MITKRIFEQVRELIEEEARDKNPGDLLHTEVQYAAQFGVSRPTVRKAVDDLIRIGLIKRMPGKGLIINTRHDVLDRGKLLIVLPYKIGDGFMFKILMGCVEQANILGFQYKIYHDENTDRLFAQIKNENFSDYVGIVTCYYEDKGSREHMDLCLSTNLPVILVDNPPRKNICPCITSNDYKGGYLMGQHLAKRGHKNIINIDTDYRSVETISRRNIGFIDALHEENIDYDESLIIKGYIPELMQKITAEDFKTHKYTAICSHSTLLITQLSQFFHDNQLLIGEDVSLIGYGQHPYMSISGIPITSIEQPAVEIGRSAVDEISASLIDKRALRSVEHDVWLIDRHTVKRI